MSDSTYTSAIQPPAAKQVKSPDNKAETIKGVSTPTSDNNAVKSRIRDVWKANFEEERRELMKLLEKYTTVAVDIEYPGVVFQKGEIQDYSTIKKNVDALKMIQVGFSVCDDNGVLPEGVNTWQFNLHFDLTKDPHSQDSIQLLRTAGLNFDNHAAHGIDHLDFAEWFTVSNLPFNDEIKWICFSGCYDYPYLLKSLTNKLLPPNESDFYNELKMYFPLVYDLKFIIKDIPTLKYCSLQKLATELGRPRTGKNHQAGSDALLTLETFFKVKETYTRNFIDNYKYGNILAGMNGERGGEDLSNQVDSYSPFASPALFPDYTAQFMANPLFAAFPQINMPQQSMGANLAMYHYYPEFQMGKQVAGNMGILYQGYAMDGF